MRIRTLVLQVFPFLFFCFFFFSVIKRAKSRLYAVRNQSYCPLLLKPGLSSIGKWWKMTKINTLRKKSKYFLIKTSSALNNLPIRDTFYALMRQHWQDSYNYHTNTILNKLMKITNIKCVFHSCFYKPVINFSCTF